jgi:putative membrane protein
MTSLNRKSLFKQLVTVAGIAGVSSLIAVPGLAELNRQTNGFNQSGDRVFDLADNATDDRTAPGSPATEPNNNNNPGRSPNSPTTPSNNNNPGRSPNSPTTPSNNNNPGRSPNSPTTPSNNNNPGRSPNSPAGGQTSPNSLSSKDKTFVMQAGQLGMMEVELGRLAVKRGSSAGVKQYGQEMVEEHTRANQELMQLAMQKKVELPAEMSTQNTALIDRLSGLSGKSFDTAYKQAMIDSHNQAIALFQAQSQQGQDPQLKAWAAQKLPNLQAHLKMVTEMLADTSQQ